MRKIAILLFILVSIVPLCAKAHSGKTDGNGGHRDSDDYHYHHGYPAHDHYDMDGDGDLDCPYDFDDKTGQNSGSSSSSGNKNQACGVNGIQQSISEPAIPKSFFANFKANISKHGFGLVVAAFGFSLFFLTPLATAILYASLCFILLFFHKESAINKIDESLFGLSLKIVIWIILSIIFIGIV